MNERTVLIVEDEAALAAGIAELVRRLGYRSVTAPSVARGARELRLNKPALVVLDIGLPDKSGIDLLTTIRELDAELPVLIVTAHGSLQNAVEAKKRGATGYMVKPLDLGELARTMRSMLEARVARSPAVAAEASEEHAPVLIGSSPAMQPAFAAIAHACASDVPVLISGPTGIGKSLTARIVHRHSPRHAAPFVTLSCSGLTTERLERELLGEQAAGGTLFLDEVGDLSAELQARLLAVVDGGGGAPDADLRILAATNQDLDAAVAAGRFREDLLYRLRVLEVPLPPLRERRSDLPALCAFVLARVAGARAVGLSEQAMQLLSAYEWPGNVRELRNVIERAVAVCGGAVILPEHLPENVRAVLPNRAAADEVQLDGALHEWLERRLREQTDYNTLHDDLEFRLLTQLLARYEGKPTLLARALDMNRATLRRKLRARSSAAAKDDDGDE